MFISLARYHRWSASKQLRQFLVIFLASTPLSLVNTFLIIDPFNRLLAYMFKMLKKTLYFFFFVFVAAWFASSALTLFV